jgi:hypothetical protein
LTLVSVHDALWITKALTYSISVTKGLFALKYVRQDDKANFSCDEQGLAMMLVMQNQHSTFVRLPTGCGKSLVVIAPTIFELGKTTVILYPLAALLKDQEMQIQRMGLPCQVWSPSLALANAASKIVLAHVSSANHPDFLRLLSELQIRNRLQRIVFDEAHVLVDWTYQKAILEAPDLRATVMVPFIFLSGSLTDTAMEKIAKDFDLKEYKEISKSAVRFDVRFCRIPVPLFGNGEDQCLEHLNTDLATLSGEDRIMIFCAFKGTMHSLKDALDAKDVTSTVFYGDLIDKTGALEEWWSGASRIMVTTEALALGINYPSVRFVYVVTEIKSLSLLAQMAGRGGRDGKTSEVKLFLRAALPSTKVSHDLALLYQDTTYKCLRVLIYTPFDKKVMTCIERSEGGLCTACQHRFDKIIAQCLPQVSNVSPSQALKRLPSISSPSSPSKRVNSGESYDETMVNDVEITETGTFDAQVSSYY